MKRGFLAVAGFACLFALAGCDDHRSTAEKMYAPNPDYATRAVMACPQCGAPQRPYCVTETHNYYRCSGQTPKFPYHEEHKWNRAIEPKIGEQ